MKEEKTLTNKNCKKKENKHRDTTGRDSRECRRNEEREAIEGLERKMKKATEKRKACNPSREARHGVRALARRENH